MEENYLQVASPLLQSEDHDDFKRWQERQRGSGRRIRTVVLLVISCLVYYVEYFATKVRNDQVLAQYSALKAQYDRIEAMRNESLTEYCASKAQHTGTNAKKSDNIPNSLKTPQ
jgi:hypothetical protein